MNSLREYINNEFTHGKLRLVLGTFSFSSLIAFESSCVLTSWACLSHKYTLLLARHSGRAQKHRGNGEWRKRDKENERTVGRVIVRVREKQREREECEGVGECFYERKKVWVGANNRDGV